MTDRKTADRRLVHFLLPLAAGLSLVLAACNTIEGAGEDVEAAGEAVSDAARQTEEELTD